MTRSRSFLPLSFFVLLLFTTTMTSPSWAQDQELPENPENPAIPAIPAIPDPKPEDVESIDAIITAVYDAISGPASEDRDWDRFLSLFAPNARLIPTARTQDGEVTLRVMSPQTYAERAAGFFKQPGGFFEREIGRKTDEFGNIAQVFSSYASFREGEDEPFMRGINSFQLFQKDGRWAVVSIFWDSERAGNPIPEQYLFESDSE